MVARMQHVHMRIHKSQHRSWGYDTKSLNTVSINLNTWTLHPKSEHALDAQPLINACKDTSYHMQRGPQAHLHVLHARRHLLVPLASKVWSQSESYFYGGYASKDFGLIFDSMETGRF